jgi:hypothetical protein
VVVGPTGSPQNRTSPTRSGLHLALLARSRIPFYVAAPLSTIDLNIKHGDDSR